MSSLRFTYHASVIIDGVLHEIGRREPAATQTGITSVYERTLSIAASGTDTLFDVTTECLATFKFMLIVSDYDLALEFITDDGAEVGEAIYTVEIKGSGTTNKFGFPHIFSTDDSIANHTVGFAGTWDVIEQVDCKNRSSTQAVKCAIFACT